MDLGSCNDRLTKEAGNIGGPTSPRPSPWARATTGCTPSCSATWSTPTVFLDVDGGAGNDDVGLVAVDLYIDTSATLDALIDGGAGNDLVTGEPSLDATSSGLLGISSLGRRGNDRVAPEVYGTDNLADGNTGVLDGGPGRDDFFATPEIQMVNVEPVSKKRR
jgi:hypothetical protein